MNFSVPFQWCLEFGCNSTSLFCQFVIQFVWGSMKHSTIPHRTQKYQRTAFLRVQSIHLCGHILTEGYGPSFWTCASYVALGKKQFSPLTPTRCGHFQWFGGQVR